MKTWTNTATAKFGGVAAVGLAVAFGGVGVSSMGATPAVTTPSSSSMPALHGAMAPASSAGTHIATLAGCVVGANC